MFEADLSLEVHNRVLSCLGVFGGNDDYTAGTGSTIDTGRTCILQDCDALDIVRVECTSCYAIHDIERI